MADIIDIDAGKIVSGESTIEEMGTYILDYCIEGSKRKYNSESCTNEPG
jgi:altronate dehydratase